MSYGNSVPVKHSLLIAQLLAPASTILSYELNCSKYLV